MRIFWLGALVIAMGVIVVPDSVIGQGPSESLDVQISPEGIGIVHATLTLPTDRERVRSVLTDFPNWPELFPRSPSIHHIEKMKDRVRVSMSMPAFFVPITLQLVTETHEPQPFRIVTQMVEGDFDRYDWVWELSSIKGGTHTLGTLALHVKPNIWTPDWAFQLILESDLQKHFDILRAKVMDQNSPKRLDSD